MKAKTNVKVGGCLGSSLAFLKLSPFWRKGRKLKCLPSKHSQIESLVLADLMPHQTPSDFLLNRERAKHWQKLKDQLAKWRPTVSPWQVVWEALLNL